MLSDDRRRAHLAEPEVSVNAVIPRGDRPRERRDMEAFSPALMMFHDADRAAQDDLDSEAVTLLHRRMVAFFLQELDIQAPERAQMATDEDYYDSLQWSAEDERVLRERGQDPLVLNVIAQSINWLLGSQKRARADYKVLPRTKDMLKDAQVKTQILKYLEDVNHSIFSESDAFAEAVKAGVSYLECGVREDTDGEPIYDAFESWRNVIRDSADRSRDGEGGRYLFRMRWTDADHACQLFPDRKGLIEASIDSWDNTAYGDATFGDDPSDSVEQYRDVGGGRPDPHSPEVARRRVRLIEAWFKVPEQTDIMAGGSFSGEVFDPYSRGHIMEVAAGRASVRRRLIFRTYVMVMTTQGALWFGPSPYRHNRYPLTPIYAYRRARDGAPYGYIRNMRDPQSDINRRFLRALHIMASNKVVMDKGAVADLEEFTEEIARPDAVIVKEPGKELTLNAERGLEASHLTVMQMSLQMIQTASGVTDEAMGRSTNATSGKAINARQDQAVVSSGLIFDNFRAAKLFHGAKKLSLVEQFMDAQKVIRITDSRGKADFVQINDGLPENDIARSKCDFVVAEDAWSATVRQAQVAELFNMLTQLAPAAPQLVMMLLDVIVEGMDIPSRDLLVKRIREETGKEDPDAEPDEDDPERIAREKQKAMQAEMQQRAAMAELAKLEGEAAAAQAKAQRESAQAAKTMRSMTADEIANMRQALELALAMLTSPPGTAETADVLLTQVGVGDTGTPTQPTQQPPAMGA